VYKIDKEVDILKKDRFHLTGNSNSQSLNNIIIQDNRQTETAGDVLVKLKTARVHVPEDIS